VLDWRVGSSTAWALTRVGEPFTEAGGTIQLIALGALFHILVDNVLTDVAHEELVEGLDDGLSMGD
jgi:hypothetical protein